MVMGLACLRFGLGGFSVNVEPETAGLTALFLALWPGFCRFWESTAVHSWPGARRVHSLSAALRPWKAGARSRSCIIDSSK